MGTSFFIYIEGEGKTGHRTSQSFYEKVIAPSEFSVLRKNVDPKVFLEFEKMRGDLDPSKEEKQLEWKPRVLDDLFSQIVCAIKKISNLGDKEFDLFKYEFEEIFGIIEKAKRKNRKVEVLIG